MTLIVGILCKDGVVVASDSAATLAVNVQIKTVGQLNVTKVRNLGDSLLFAGSGSMGMLQLVAEAIESKWKASGYTGLRSAEEAMRKLGDDVRAQLEPVLRTTNLTRPLTGDASSALCKTLIAMPVKKEGTLITFDFNGAPEHATKDLPFVAMGSGQAIADPFLAFLRSKLWRESEPTLPEGRLVATWTIDHVCNTNPGGVGGDVQLGVLDCSGPSPRVTISGKDEIAEHREQIAQAEAAFVRAVRGEGASGSEPPTAP